jgi:surface protein
MKENDIMKKILFLNSIDDSFVEIGGIKDNIIDFQLKNNPNDNNEKNIQKRKIKNKMKEKQNEYKGISLLYNQKEKRYFRKHIRKRIHAKIKDISLDLVYNSKEVNLDLTFNELNEKLSNKIVLYAYKKNNTKGNESNKIICPKCGEPIEGDIFKCKNNHDIKNEMRILRKNIDNLKKNVNEIIKIFNVVIENVEKYYEINNSNMMNNSSNNNIVNKKKIIKYTSQIIENRKINLDDIINIYNKINSAITIKYKIEENQKAINLFGSDFVKENKKNCQIICNDKIYELTENFDITDYVGKEKNILEIKLAGINNISSMESMFSRCNSLLSLPDINKWDMVKVNNMSKLFFGCTSLESLPDISTFNTINVEHIGNMFSSCS